MTMDGKSKLSANRPGAYGILSPIDSHIIHRVEDPAYTSEVYAGSDEGVFMKNNQGILKPHVLSINISKGGIPKLPIDSVCLSDKGLEGDGHDHEKHYRLEQAVCLQDIEMLDQLRGAGYCVYAGATGENLTAKNLNVNEMPLGTVLEFSGGVVLEITKVRKPCYVLDSIHPQLKDAIIGRCGMYARVLKEGIVSLHEEIRAKELLI